ncbi:MAG: hypothetical protein HON65_11825 [Rhodospirillales bacterium]|jgi:hypothetical protein|nr:hypothetical protein [Rhodospirillales bacterium]
MSTITPIVPRTGNIPATPSSNRATGYQGTHEVRVRANVMAGNETPAQQNAINRLNETLKADEAPRDDVPRGYYLDILV